jgi:hypothetical protein
MVVVGRIREEQEACHSWLKNQRIAAVEPDDDALSQPIDGSN